MKKIFLIFTLIVSSYVFANERLYPGFDKYRPFYEVCSSQTLGLTVTCVNEYMVDGFEVLSGLHAIETSRGTVFFQALTKTYTKK